MIRMLTAGVLLLAIWSPIVAQGGLVVGTEPEGDGGFGVGFSFSADVNLVIAQEFWVNEPARADNITVYLNGDGTDNPQGEFTLQVMNQIGPAATAANVLWSETGTFPAGPLPTGHAPVTFTGVGVDLDMGSYYLVISSAAGPGTGWGTGANLLAGGIGEIGNSFVGIVTGGGVGDYTALEPTNPSASRTNFRIDAVPEPASLLLALVGLPAAMAIRRLGRRRG